MSGDEEPETAPELTPETAPESAPELTPAERAARKRRLAEVFGDVLPEQTTDDREPRGADTDAAEEWLKRQVPPHHG